MDQIDMNLKPKGVTRYRKMPLVVGVVIFGLLLFYLIMQLSHRTDTARDQAKEQQSEIAVPASPNSRTPYWFEDEKYSHPAAPLALPNALPAPEEKPLQPSTDVLARAALAASEAPMQRPADLPAPAPQDSEADKAHSEAIHAPARVTFSYGISGTASGMPAPRPVEKNADSPSPAPSSKSSLQDNSNEAFLHKPVEEAVYLNHRKTAPVSDTELKAGSIIPAALITGLNSDLPGSVIGQVRENIYDTVSGNHLVIPQGARLIGEYDARVHFGQDRALVVWTRLIFPDGNSITLERMQGADSSGYSGFSDEVNHHYGRIYGNALLMSVLGSGYELLNQDTSSSNDPAMVDTVAAAIGQQLAQVSSEMIRKNLSIQPTITIKAGYKFNVMVMKDMVLDALH